MKATKKVSPPKKIGLGTRAMRYPTIAAAACTAAVMTVETMTA